MVTPPAGCPDTVATLTWLKTSTTSSAIFARAPLVMSVRNTGPGYLLSSADDDVHGDQFRSVVADVRRAHPRRTRSPAPARPRWTALGPSNQLASRSR